MSQQRSLLILFAVFTLVHIPLLLGEISGAHKWRQSDTAAVTKNFYQESANIFYPRVDIRGGLSGITGMEFPIYQYITSPLYNFVDIDSDAPGKFIAFICMTLALLLLSTLAKQCQLTESRSTLITVAMTTPFVFYYSSAFMPEAFALMMALAGILCFIRYTNTRQRGCLVLMIVTLTLGSLSRPYVIFLCYPLVHYSGQCLLRKQIDWLVLGSGLVILAFFAGWYLFWAPYLVEHFGIDYFYFGSDLRHNLAEIASTGFWSNLMLVLSQNYLDWVWLPFFLYGLYCLRKNDLIVQLAIASLLALVSLGILTGRHFSPHVYYLIAFLPLLVCCAAYSYDKLLARSSELRRCVLGVVLIVLMALSQIHIYRDYKDPYKARELRPLLEQQAPRDQLVIAEDFGTYAHTLYFLRRKGWLADAEHIRDLGLIEKVKAEGAKWVLPIVDDRLQLYAIDDWISSLAAQ